MAKKKQQDETEQLKQKIKELESTNRVLRKRLKRLEQFAHEAEEIVENEIESLKEEDNSQQDENKCPECGDYLNLVKIAGRSFKQCVGKPACKYRTKAIMDDNNGSTKS